MSSAVIKHIDPERDVYVEEDFPSTGHTVPGPGA